MPPRPSERVTEPTDAAREIPFGARFLGAPKPQRAAKPEPPPDTLECECSATLQRGESYGRQHVVWLRLEVERGTMAAARLVNLAESGLMRGKSTRVHVGMNSIEVRA